MYRAKILIICLLISIAGCQSQPVSKTGPARDITVGSILTLHQPLVIHPNSARVYLQHGRIVSVNEISRFYPNCWFEVNDVSNEKQFIAPGNYRVDSVNYYRRPFGLGSIKRGITVAGPYVAGLFDRSREIEFITEVTVVSDTPSDIRRFSCKITDDSLGRYLSLEDIRAALGAVITISPPSVSRDIR